MAYCVSFDFPKTLPLTTTLLMFFLTRPSSPRACPFGLSRTIEFYYSTLLFTNMCEMFPSDYA